ncbi:hypothetical protein CSPAE12_01115, partial [Colletotrichum incanum]
CLATSLLWIFIFSLFIPSPRNGYSAVRENESSSKGTDLNKYLAPFHNVTSTAKFGRRRESDANTILFSTIGFLPNVLTKSPKQNIRMTMAGMPLPIMGEQEVYYTSVRDHLNHCSMFWKKQFWALFEDRGSFDGVIVNPYHEEHCADFL